MCLVSVIADDFNRRHNPLDWQRLQQTSTPVSRQEFDALKKEVELLKEILQKAKEFDEKTGQPDCEKEEKIALLKKIAEIVGVDLSEVLK